MNFLNIQISQMSHSKDSKSKNNILNNLFSDIRDGKAVLFLGAGASVTDENKYLSEQLITYYRDERNISYDTKDIVKFVDRVFVNTDYDRADFDNKISSYLQNLKVQDYHKVLIDMPWVSILTTNVDLLIENAFEKHSRLSDISIIKNKKELTSPRFKDNTKFIKLHGCISDIGEYPLAFSSKDFDDLNKYYNKIFAALQQLSHDVKILFLGYSFSDEFGKRFLLKTIDELNNREMFLVDPFLKDKFDVSFFESKNIRVINTFMKDFFNAYSSWIIENESSKKDKKYNVFRTSEKIRINAYLQHKLKSFIIPINETYNQNEITAKQFYLGQEPNFSVVNRNHDVIKNSKLEEAKTFLNQKFEEENDLYPLIFLTGSFGTGKTTFAYRLINEAINDSNDMLAFHIIELQKYSDTLMTELVEKLDGISKIIFFSDHSEVDTNFKTIRAIRGSLSSKQYPDKKIIFLQAIRENTLQKFKNFHNPEIFEFNIDADLTESELSNLIENYAKEGLLNYRDGKEKQSLIQQSRSLFKGNDQYLFLLKFIEAGNHKNSLLETYKDLSEDMKKAFLYTSILYQFGIPMPWSLLRDIISRDWEEFKRNVIETEGYGILTQYKTKPDRYLLPDLYFKIKHALIAETLVKEILKKESDFFKHCRVIILNLSDNEISVYIANNFLRALGINRSLDQSKINKLYDDSFKKLNGYPHFCLSYARHLQQRGTIKDLKNALNVLQESSIDLDYDMYSRNSRFIHRRAVLNHKLSQKYNSEKDFGTSREYFEEALDLFQVKLSLDPGSLYSYKDFLSMLIQTLRFSNSRISDVEKLKIQLKARGLIKKAKSNLQEGIGKITKLQTSLELLLEDYKQMKEQMDSLIEDPESKPYALLLKFEIFENAYDLLGYEISEEEIIDEISYYDYNEDVITFLFNYYGQNLNYYDYRMKFFKLCKQNSSLLDNEKINWHFYHFKANAYSHRMKEAWEELTLLRTSFNNILLKENHFWKVQDGEENCEFTGKIIKNNRGYLTFKVNEMGGRLRAKVDMNTNKKLVPNNEYYAHLYFTYTGVWAKVLSEE